MYVYMYVYFVKNPARNVFELSLQNKLIPPCKKLAPFHVDKFSVTLLHLFCGGLTEL